MQALERPYALSYSGTKRSTGVLGRACTLLVTPPSEAPLERCYVLLNLDRVRVACFSTISWPNKGSAVI